MDLGSPPHLQHEREGWQRGGHQLLVLPRCVVTQCWGGCGWLSRVPHHPICPWGLWVHPTTDPPHPPWLLHVSPTAEDICSGFPPPPSSPGRRCSFNLSKSSGRSNTFSSGSHQAATSPDCIKMRVAALSAVSDPTFSSFLGWDGPILVGSWGTAFSSALLDTPGSMCVGMLPPTPCPHITAGGPKSP